jgi:hypothetical protein
MSAGVLIIPNAVDLKTWRLRIGNVSTPVSLSLFQLMMRRPRD